MGRTLGGVYRIKRHVATGGFANLYEGWHEVLETPVAVKVRRMVGVDGDPEGFARNDDYCFAHFKTEAILGFRLRDPHVVRVLDFRLEAKVEYLVMEWLEGKSLQVLADGRPMYWRRAVELMAKAADAVASLHAAGWFHRDIKPDNFMVLGGGDDDERVVLIDLGLVRQRPLAAPIVSQLAEPTAWIAHTPGYCAPEVYAQIKEKKIETSPFTEASEVFALGVTLYKLLTGRIPWDGHTAQQQQAEIADGSPPIPLSRLGTHVPTELDHLLQRALGTDPARRPRLRAGVRPRAAARPGADEVDGRGRDCEAARGRRGARGRRSGAAERRAAGVAREPAALALGPVAMGAGAVVAGAGRVAVVARACSAGGAAARRGAAAEPRAVAGGGRRA
ncbi:serine/threonine-protein kinase [Nannocystis pusilla]|uniref:serine/threonine-protein kinase n=1 Tax=Nannocystis pusilla TaxID=889268 RepID=UPI003DA6ACA7